MHGSLNGYRLVTSPDLAQMDEIFRLRGFAWRSRLPAFAAPAVWQDTEDSTCLHWAILHGGEVVAAARLCVAQSLEQVPDAEVYSGVFPALDGPVGSINRLVVHPAHAKRGLSEWLDRERMAHADAVGVQHVVAHTFAGMPRVAALCSVGFRVAGKANHYTSGLLENMNALLCVSGEGERQPLSTVALIRTRIIP